MSTFLDRLREAAQHAGVEPKQSDVARALNVSRQVVNTWYIGRSVPGAEMLLHIAHTFGVRAEWLQSADGAMLRETEDLSPDERELVKNYRTAAPKVRDVIRTMVRAARKVAVVVTAAIPPLMSSPDEAQAGVLHNVNYGPQFNNNAARIHIAQLWQFITGWFGRGLSVC